MDGAIAADRKRYEDLYEEEGYQLSASADIFIPWFQCTLKCRCEKEQQMSELDRIVCKCILRGIDSAADISFVLLLDTEIVKGEIEELLMSGILAEHNGKLEMTAAGKECYARKAKAVAAVQEYPVYMNAVTGEWRMQPENYVPQSLVPDAAIQLMPLKAVIRSDVEKHAGIRQHIRQEYGMHMISAQLLDYQLLVCQKEEILFYENDAKEVLFAFYDTVQNQPDTMLANALLQKYQRREVIELIQAERHLKTAEEKFVEQNAMLAGYQGRGQQFRYLRNREIRELLIRTLDEAEEEIFIISPWISDFVVDDRFFAKMDKALERGVSITIGYGYISAERMERKRRKFEKLQDKWDMASDKDWQSVIMAQKIQKRFADRTALQIFYVREGTHEKILSYDRRYTLIGSYNLLSYDGGEKVNYSGVQFRFEGGILIEDASFAREVQMKFSVLH